MVLSCVIKTNVFILWIQAGALMIVGLMSNKIALPQKVIKFLVQRLTEIAYMDAMDSTDLQSCRLSLIALINLVQVLIQSDYHFVIG